MKLWTHHPSDFDLANPQLQVDPSKGQYQKSAGKGFRYSTVLPLLHAKIGSSQLLWCCTDRGRYLPCAEPSDLVEWEINLPLSQVQLIDRDVWEDIIWSRGDCWDVLFVSGLSEDEAMNRRINALIQLPLPEGYVTCHGKLPASYLASGHANPVFRSYLESIGRDFFQYDPSQ